MAIRIKARAGESADQMMRRFKKMCEKEGLTKNIKRRAYYEKTSERQQRAPRQSVKRAQEAARGGPLKRGPPGSKPQGPPPRGGRPSGRPGGRPTGRQGGGRGPKRG